MKNKVLGVGGIAVVCVLSAAPSRAAEWNVSGFIQEEVAVKTTKDVNIANQAGIPANGVPETNTGLFAAATPTLTRPAELKRDNDLNMLATRLEVNLDGKFSENFQAHFKLRGFTDQIGSVEKAFKGQNLFQQEYGASHSGGRLGIASNNWMLDLPVAYLDYNQGPLWLRIGNQQIAWGEAIFFRVSDVPNGLDLRRHLVYDVAAEEYSDKRVSAPAIRGSFRANENWEIEGFTQMAQPSILPGENSPYNPIGAQFAIHEKEGYDAIKNKWNFGARMRGKLGDVGVQGFAVRRVNPDGVFRWTTATGPGAIAGTPFQAGTGLGVYSAQEWFRAASMSRLDGIGGLDAAINGFPATTGLGANAVAGACGAPSSAVGAVVNSGASASCVLDTLFTPNGGLGELRGHLAREYFSENVFGFGLNHVFEGEPDTFLDQLIARFEASYTPNRRFTNPTLSSNYIKKNESQFAVIVEKYHKFSDSFPATYIVGQWLHKSASDLFGRALEGMDNIPGERPRGQKHGFNAIAFALQQPSPTLEWRFDMTVLTDLQGGWMLQPGVRWKPSKSVQLDFYGNVLLSTNNDGRNFAQDIKNANEAFVRATMFF